jgi:epoxyqueuosine reductase
LIAPRGAEAGLRALADVGVDVWGVADGAAYGHVLTGCRAVVVVAARGRASWEHARARGGHDPVDGAVRDALRDAPAHGGRWVRFASDAPEHGDPTAPVPNLDARALAHAAGLGTPGRLGILMHPDAGPWLALRAAWFTTDALAPTGPLPGPAPCATCAAPCADACPAGALDGGAWDVARCVAWRTGETTGMPGCPDTCAARSACPEGATYRYSDAQHAHHHREAVRRGWIRPARSS